MPAAWKIDWVFAPGSNKGHVLDAWNRLGISILEQVQAQQLGKGGARVEVLRAVAKGVVGDGIGHSGAAKGRV
jgi:hypothetical protein